MDTKDKTTAALFGNVAFIGASTRKVKTRAMKQDDDSESPRPETGGRISSRRSSLTPKKRSDKKRHRISLENGQEIKKWQ